MAWLWEQHSRDVIVYDSEASDGNGSVDIGEYWHSSEPYGVQLTIGNLTFATDPCNVDFLMYVDNDRGASVFDRYGFISGWNLWPTTGESLDYSISWGLKDESATAVDNAMLLTDAPVLSDWIDQNELIIGSPWGEMLPYKVTGHVTDVTLIPEPTMLGLLAGGAALVWKQIKVG